MFVDWRMRLPFLRCLRVLSACQSSFPFPGAADLRRERERRGTNEKDLAKSVQSLKHEIQPSLLLLLDLLLAQLKGRPEHPVGFSDPFSPHHRIKVSRQFSTSNET